MIYLYSGTPGSGKSLKASQEIEFKLVKRAKNVICCNYDFNYEYIRQDPKKIKKNNFRKSLGLKEIDIKRKKIGRLYTLSIKTISPDFFYKYAQKFHVVGQESQTLIIMDECQSWLSPTVMKLKCQEDKFYREKWIEFFTQHRHLGFDVILITQFDRLLDPQIRCLIEYDYSHRKANNFGFMGVVLSLLGITLFVQIQKWYGVREKIAHEFFVYKKKYKNYYNSYKKFADMKAKAGASN